MSQSRKRKRSPKQTLALPDLEQSKAAVLNSLTSKSGQRSYDRAITDFVEWYCPEPRLSFNRTVVLRYRIFLEPLCANDNQPSACCRAASCPPSSGFRAAQSGIGRWHPTGQGCSADRSPAGKLADSRPKIYRRDRIPDRQ